MLSNDEIKAFYDRFGKKQDTQAFYEDAAANALAVHGLFDQAEAVFEFGVGTGRFAEKLLGGYLTVGCRYTGIDISSTMVELASSRLRRWGDRISVELSNGGTKLPVPDGTFDRFLSSYVLDLLDPQDACTLMDEAHRILTVDGLLCLVSLTPGKTWLSRGVSSAWNTLYKIRPKLVGGCRPIELQTYVLESSWKTEYHATVSAFGITSEVLVARRLP